jgi:hypothetical protein
MTSTTKPQPSWRDVKAELERFDRAGLLRLLKDLHEVSRDNQAFLNARLGLGAAPLVPYKKLISRWIAPDVMKGQDISVAKAKKAISNYRKPLDIRKASPNSHCFSARKPSACCCGAKGTTKATTQPWWECSTKP